MKRILCFAIMAFTGLLSVAQTGKTADNDAEKRDLKGFHAVAVSSGIDLYLTQGNEETVAVSADASVRGKIITEVDQGVLKIYMKSTFLWRAGARRSKVYVSFKMLDALRASGGSGIYAEDGLKTDRLTLTLSGGSSLKGKVDTRQMEITESGGSGVHISGTAPTLSVRASGGSNLHGYDLSTEVCHVTSSGGSDIQVSVNKELSVVSSGGSDVYYKGACSVQQVSTSGGSGVIKKG